MEHQFKSVEVSFRISNFNVEQELPDTIKSSVPPMLEYVI